MKNILIRILLFSLPFVFTSCFEEVDLGFPDTIVFSDEGGMKTVAGDAVFASAEVHDYRTGEQGEDMEVEDGIWCNSFKWLKVEYEKHSEKLTIHAAPNTAGKSRELHVAVYSGPEYDVIKVVQE